MIQRLQTLWLIVAAFVTFLTFKFPFYSGSIIDKNNQLQGARFTAQYDTLTLALTAILLGVIVIDIFLFKNRKLQLRLAILALIISIIDICVYFSKLKTFAKGELSLASIFSFVLPVILFIAVRGIWKDERLIKSLDRLR